MSRLIAVLIVIVTAGLALAVPRYGSMVVLAAPDSGRAREPARQVPVEEVEEVDGPSEPMESVAPDKPAGDGVVTGAVSAADAEKKASAERLPVKTGTSAAPDDGFRDKTAAVPETESEADGAGQDAGADGVGLPSRKPAGPPVRITGRLRPDTKKTSRDGKLPPPGRARDKYLCKALQTCRNEFVRCKSKIKHPDQSKEWSIAKEACGAEYRNCVEKDFRSGEWFFTRWFYFQELECE